MQEKTFKGRMEWICFMLSTGNTILFSFPAIAIKISTINLISWALETNFNALFKS